MVLCQGEPPRRFVAVDLHFIFDLNFVVVLHLSTFFIHICFRHHPSLVRRLSWSFYTNFILSAQPIAERFATLSFSTIPLSSYRERYSFGWTFFTLCSFTDILPAFINASLGAGRQFFLEVCWASYWWSSKHRPGPSVWLIHSNPVFIFRTIQF